LAYFLYTFHTKQSFSPLFAGSRLAFSATVLISAVFVEIFDFENKNYTQKLNFLGKG
jgi:hypothetical protein